MLLWLYIYYIYIYIYMLKTKWLFLPPWQIFWYKWWLLLHKTNVQYRDTYAHTHTHTQPFLVRPLCVYLAGGYPRWLAWCWTPCLKTQSMKAEWSLLKATGLSDVHVQEQCTEQHVSKTNSYSVRVHCTVRCNMCFNRRATVYSVTCPSSV